MVGGAATERELIAACRNGDRAAADELMRRHQGHVARIVLRLVGRPSLVEDIVQEAFLRTLEQIDRIDPEQGARRWVLRVAINLARTQGKRSRRSELVPQVADDAAVLFAAPERDPEQRLLSAEAHRRYREALDRMPPKLREVLVLRHVEELPFSEIAALLRTPSAVLRMRALRARARLLSDLGGDAP